MNLIRGTVWRVLSALALLSATAAPARAGYILQSTAISSPQGSFNQLFDLSNVINQSGLSAPYTSGVTDFNAYTASATHDSDTDKNSGYTSQKGGYPQQISFDFGSARIIDAIAVWAADSKSSVTEFRESVTQFRLFQDTDSDPLNGTGPQMGGVFNPLANGGAATPAQVFTFAPTTTRFVQLIVDNTAGGNKEFPGIGEVAFQQVTPIPEPGSLTLLAVGAVTIAGRGWRRRRGGRAVS